MECIDAVYLWVDGNDSARVAQRRFWERIEGHGCPDGRLHSRFADHEELRYSLRSLQINAPWIRTTFVITDGQRPAWLDVANPRIRFVDHRELFPDTSVLPTYNSMVIELYLDRILGLAEQFLLLNDDFFMGQPLPPDFFFTPDGKVRVCLTEELCPTGSITSTDPAWIAGLKNANAILDRRCGPQLRRIPLHQIRPMRRGICERFRSEHAEECRRASLHRFRSHEDIAFPWHVHPYLALHWSIGILAKMSHRWIGITDDSVANAQAFRSLCENPVALFCLNDQDMGEDPLVLGGLRSFLDSYFPHPSPFERVGTASVMAGGS